jgi:hypothetical protein
MQGPHLEGAQIAAGLEAEVLQSWLLRLICCTFNSNRTQPWGYDLSDIKKELKSSTEAVRQSTAATQQNINTGEETRAAAKEASETSKAVLEMTREIKTRGLQNQANGPMTYAAMAARGQTLAGTYNTQSPKGPSAQAQREVIVNIRDSFTIQSLRAMNPVT